MATTVDSSVETYTIIVEPLTPESFAPFGTVLTRRDQERLPINLYGGKVDVYRPAAIDADQPLEWLLTRNHVRDFQVTYLERHHGVAQAFVALEQPFISCVAAPDCDLVDGVPAFDQVHAFIIPAGQAAQIHKGTWHEPPFAIVDQSYTLITSHQALTAGLGLALDGKGEIGDLDVDKRNILERTGKQLRIAFG